MQKKQEKVPLKLSISEYKGSLTESKGKKWTKKDIELLQKEYEKKHEQTMTLMRSIMSVMQSYVIVLDRECKKVLYSNLGYNNVGYITEGKNGEKILDTEHLYESVLNKDVIHEVLECLYNQIPCSIERKLEFSTGRTGNYRIKVEQIMEEGSLAGTLLVIKNITEETEKKENLIAATYKQKKAFMALSHEFRTPINAIAGSIDMLSLSEGLNTKEKSHIRNIKQAYKSLLSIVAKATDYTNLQEGDLVIEKREFTIPDLLDNICVLTYVRAFEKEIGYCVDIAPDVPARLIGDLEKISRVLQSFLYNAIEHTSDGCVTLRIYRKQEEGKEYICYSVKDTGKGIKEEFVKRIFDEFIGFEICQEEYAEGLGISLYVSKKIIELMGGKAECKSCYGEGSTFEFQLELETPEDKPIVTVKHAKKKSILLCTDVPWKKDYIKRVCDALQIGTLRMYDEVDLSKEQFTHVIIDSRYKEARMLLEEDFAFAKKVLVLVSSQDKLNGTGKADFIIYEPFTIMMFAEMLAGEAEQKEETEGADSVGELVFQLKDVKALVVDDNAVNLMVASNVLMQYGIKVEEADSGTMAVKKYYENDEFDIIFMDYLMPDMNGVETIRNIRNLKRNKETIFIALSANVTDEIVEAFESAGAHHVMAKPLELKELSEVLRKYLPEAKFVKESATEEQTGQLDSNNAADKEGVKSILYKVKGLNVEKGLANVMGVMETYIKVLNVCCTNITEQAEYIKAAYKLVSLGGLKIYFHSLKGILANIGAMELSEFSKNMEIASRDQNEAYIKENVVSYIEKIESFRDNLQWAINEYKKITESDMFETHKSMNKQEYDSRLEQLLTCIRRFEFNEISVLMEELILVSKDETREEFKKAYNYIQEFQYEEALEMVEEIRSRKKPMSKIPGEKDA